MTVVPDREFAYSGPYVIGLGERISDAEVLDIIHSHPGFREDYDPSELMSDEEFLRRYHEIIEVPERGIVDGEMAGRIEYLRALYEKLPLRDNSKYDRATVRLQTSSKKFSPLSKEEMRIIFAGKLERVNRYRIRDILNVTLGRWHKPVGGEKQSPKKYAKRGRPKKEKSLTSG
jgi:hypothetical protein